MTFNIKDMAISLDMFGSTPIKKEGEMVVYDIPTGKAVETYETEVNFDPTEVEWIEE